MKNKMSLRGVLVTITVISLSHIVVGKLHYIKNIKSGWMNHGDPYKKQLVELQNYGNGFALKGLGNSRDKRGTPSGPEAAAPYILQGDNHGYANVRYSGDESDVSIRYKQILRILSMLKLAQPINSTLSKDGFIFLAS